MIKNSLIIIPFQLPWDWSADYQKQTCLTLAKNNSVIAYIDGDSRFFLKKRPKRNFPKLKNILFYQPRYLLPLRRFSIIEISNKFLNLWYLLLRFGKNRDKKLVWIFDPMFWFFPKIRYFYPRVKSLYDCVDYYWNLNHALKKRIWGMEQKLILSVNYFFVNSYLLEKKKRLIRKPDAVVPQGFDFESFKPETKYRQPEKRELLKIKKAFSKIPKPIVGFIGALTYRLDFKLILALVRNMPQVSFVFTNYLLLNPEEDLSVGTSEFLEKIRKCKNVFFVPKAKRPGVKEMIKHFSIGIVPYDISFDFNKYCFPMKLFEYFYAGIPVISTPIEELKRFSKYVMLSNSVYGWETAIKYYLSKPWPKEYKIKQRNLAEENSWEKKIEAITNIVYDKS